MPKQKQRPTTIVSDSESDGPEVQPPTPLGAKETKPTAKQQPGRLRRVYTLEDDDSDNALSVSPNDYVSRPTVTSTTTSVSCEVDKKVDITELVSVLTRSNASMKGRINDSGRFELEFELLQGPRPRGLRRSDEDHYADAAPSNQVVTPPVSPERRARPGKRIAWIKN